MKDKVRIENVGMRVIKWERIWSDERERERERERETNDTCCDYKPISEESIVVAIAKLKIVELLALPRRTHGHNISLGTNF